MWYICYLITYELVHCSLQTKNIKGFILQSHDVCHLCVVEQFSTHCVPYFKASKHQGTFDHVIELIVYDRWAREWQLGNFATKFRQCTASSAVLLIVQQ